MGLASLALCSISLKTRGSWRGTDGPQFLQHELGGRESFFGVNTASGTELFQGALEASFLRGWFPETPAGGTQAPRLQPSKLFTSFGKAKLSLEFLTEK